MPAFGTSLQKENVWQVVNYLRSIGVRPPPGKSITSTNAPTTTAVTDPSAAVSNLLRAYSRLHRHLVARGANAEIEKLVSGLAGAADALGALDRKRFGKSERKALEKPRPICGLTWI